MSKTAFVPKAGYTLCHSRLSLMKDDYHYLAFGPGSKTGVLCPVRGVQGWPLSQARKQGQTAIKFCVRKVILRFFRSMSYSVAVSLKLLSVFVFVLSSGPSHCSWPVTVQPRL